MLIQYVKELSPMLSACQAAAIQIANFIQMKGTDASSVLLSKAFARSFASLPAICSGRCKGCAFCLRSLLLFARGCACTLARCLRLFFCRLRGFFCFCNTLPALHAFARLCGFYCSRVCCSRVCCSLFCAPPVRRINARRGKDGGTAGGQKPTRRGCVL